MVAGLGIDVVLEDRIREAMENPRFVERILTPAERAYCTTIDRVAGRWAAKEAIAKAVSSGLAWQDVEILPDASGKPLVKFYVPIEGTVTLSISHERGIAAAVAILER